MKINTNRWNRIRYTAVAPVYDVMVRFGAQRRRSIELLALRPGERVLIVGAGPGPDLPFIPPGVEVVAGDITPAMVDRLMERATELGCWVTAGVMDGQKLPLPDAAFDAVILHLIVAVIPDPVACLREAARVLKPDGRIAIFDKFAPEARGVSKVRRALNLVTNVLATDITRQLRPLLEAAGLTLIYREPAAFGGFFEIALAQATSPDPAVAGRR